MTTRHEFLAELHALLAPKTYLEIGVQHGWSLALAHKADLAIGVDPAPYIKATGNQVLYQMTSDDFFQEIGSEGIPIRVDLAFIDGMHLFEYALRDFMNIERYVHEKSVIVFDDVLPRNQGEADRTQCPGDWTGDVWKIHHVLSVYRPDLWTRLVDTQPTGTLVVAGFGRATGPMKGILDRTYESLEKVWSKDVPVPDDVINRVKAYAPDVALREVVHGVGPGDQV